MRISGFVSVKSIKPHIIGQIYYITNERKPKTAIHFLFIPTKLLVYFIKLVKTTSLYLVIRKHIVE